MSPPSVVIKGATGWIGRQTAIKLVNKFRENLNLTLINSNPVDICIYNKHYQTISPSSLKLDNQIDYFFDYAFQTREKIESLEEKQYVDVNLNLINHSVEIVKKLRPKTVVLTSSGAVYNSSKYAQTKKYKLYSELKAMQEQQITDVCKESGSNLIIVRIFNLSGEGMNKSKVYAFQEIIEKALKNEEIIVKSSYQVFRRYCDIGQLLDLLLQLSFYEENICFDSGGQLIEIHRLVEVVKTSLNSNSPIFFEPIDSLSTPDKYYSSSDKYELLIRKFLNQDSLSIESQVVKTAQDLISRGL
jgi:nucleoside-diphosphate-sugar epimerase